MRRRALLLSLVLPGLAGLPGWAAKARRPTLPPIHAAAAAGDEAKAKTLLKGKPALVHSQDKEGATPLHHAVAHGRKAMVSLLLSSKADVNAKKKDGVTPMHVAAAGGLEEIAQLLLSCGAEINVRDKKGRTPLAVAEGTGRTSMVTFLQYRGAKPTATAGQ